MNCWTDSPCTFDGKGTSATSYSTHWSKMICNEIQDGGDYNKMFKFFINATRFKIWLNWPDNSWVKLFLHLSTDTAVDDWMTSTLKQNLLNNEKNRWMNEFTVWRSWIRYLTMFWFSCVVLIVYINENLSMFGFVSSQR